MDDTFQYALLGAFILFGLIGVGLFATGSFGGDNDRTPVSFTVWGEWEEVQFNNLLETSGIAEDEYLTVSYEYVTPDNFQRQLESALARGEGPDVLLIPHTKLLPVSDLITVVGERFYSARTFKNTFIEGSEIYLSSSGVAALPIAIDPVVMYWNRDLFTEAGFTNPPQNWEAVSEYAQVITETDNVGNISTAGIGFGTADNVSYLQEIISSLFLQAGNNIVTRHPDRGDYRSVLTAPDSVDAVTSAVRLYTQYANPDLPTYAWNSSFTSDLQAFTANNLGMYIAPASDIAQIRAQNPNLNFDVAPLPQLSGGQERTYGDVYGFAILNQAENKSAILQALGTLTGKSAAEALLSHTRYTPVRKDVLSVGATNVYRQVFFDAAIIARAWYNPDPDAIADAFAEMVRSVTSGRENAGGAVQELDTALSNLLKQVNSN